MAVKLQASIYFSAGNQLHKPCRDAERANTQKKPQTGVLQHGREYI
jgi:hypothetical protein